MSEGQATLAVPSGSASNRGPVWPVVVITVLAVFNIAWCAVNLRGTVAPALAWVPLPVCAAVTAYAAWSVSRLSTLPEPARLLWGRLAVALVLVAFGVIGDAIDTAGFGEAWPYARPLSLGLYLACIAVVLWALLRTPVGSRSPGQWLRLGLDTAVFMLAGSLFIGHYALLGGAELVAVTGSWWSLVSIIALSCFVMLAAAKLALTGVGPLDRGALGLLALSILVSAAVSSVLTPILGDDSNVSASQIALPIGCLIMTLAAERQRRAVASEVRRSARRPFSSLPYVAVAATYVLLLLSTREADTTVRLVVVGVIALTALVVVRQLTALYDNARLLDRLDSSISELGRHERRFRSLVQNSSDITLITDFESRVTYISPSVERILGVPADHWLGRPVTQCVHPDDLPVMQEFREKLMEHVGATASCQARMRHADGSWRWLDVFATNRFDEPSVGGVVSNARDITETRRFQDQLAHQVTHDTLTQLANRTLFAERTAEELAAGHDVVLALIDIDDFKAINDRLGHAVGDALLVALADRLRGCVRPGDMVSRLGGDEFAILLRGVRGPEIEQVVEDVMLALGTAVHAADHELLAQASIGLVDGGAGMDASELLRRADVAMYAAKEQGKSGYRWYSESMDARAVEHARMGADLQRALARGELFLLYQPVVTLPHGDVYGVETLVRWRHPERGLVSPAEFIPVAERNGMIVQIGDWVLREACRQMVEWQRDYGVAAPSRVAVNVSARQLREPAFAQTVADVLAETGLRPSDLLVEITETAVFDGGPAVETVQAIQSLGVAIALDDFGTGHSSLGLLRTCPVDILKVDKLFVDGVAGTAEEAAIATSIAQIAHALGLGAVAEGVETTAQAAKLYQMGYRLAQGFHFARPLSPGDLAVLLEARLPRRGPDAMEPPALAS
ncbi:hypothetical protein Psi01_43910 [Planobispora siamensis]|uniref:PAS domain S-box-containing protein/diguanylate cyclase (GGDEF) domain-containing protein n=1 Tax=Planobispora siamensis TaxID=936338 RepID=A0A8J3SFQ9_9ACTN|nr:hypothetical protein Psi01_43910 [Planobispora siamensis]